jgi:hypothetical protein
MENQACNDLGRACSSPPREFTPTGWSWRASAADGSPESRRPAGLLEPFTDALLREGRFQRWMALVTGLSSVISGMQVGYEHYKGSYSRPVMYTPPISSLLLAGAGLAGFRSPRIARTVLPAISVVTLVNCAAGFYFHVRGIQRKPGGWRLPVFNIIMGPPLFAPLLFGVSAYLGLVAGSLRSGEQPARGLPQPAHGSHLIRRLVGNYELISWEQDLREARFQKHMAAAAALSAFFSGFEALYSHYKSNFRYKVQWTPIVVSPMLIAAGIGAVRRRSIAHTWLPAISGIAMASGGVGFFYHVRGVLRRPSADNRLYNIMWGPPVFAPLLFAASGFLGVLASLFRRERRS